MYKTKFKDFYILIEVETVLAIEYKGKHIQGF